MKEMHVPKFAGDGQETRCRPSGLDAPTRHTATTCKRQYFLSSNCAGTNMEQRMLKHLKLATERTEELTDTDIAVINEQNLFDR